MEEEQARYEATVSPDGRISRLVEWGPDGSPRTIMPEDSEGLAILGAGREVLYRFDEDRRLRNLPYLEVLEVMGQEVRLMLHKIRHGDLLDEPEAAPLLRRLLADIEATATAFRQSCGGGRAVS